MLASGRPLPAPGTGYRHGADTEQHADPFQFVLRDGGGVKHTATFIQTCPLWSAVNVSAGAGYGPKCLVFQAAGDRPAGLVLVWTPRPGSGDYNIKVS